MKQIHSGYFSDLYLKDNILIKKINIKKDYLNPENVTNNEIFNKELEGLKALASINIARVKTPDIIDINSVLLEYSQIYYANLIPFNRYIVNHQMTGYLYYIIHQFGKYLAELHNKGYTHGDLNQKNISFVNDQIFIYDPVAFKTKFHQSPYFDIARFIYNFYPYDIKARILLIKKEKLIDYFLKGYTKIRDIDKKELRETFFIMLNRFLSKPKKNTIKYRLKFFYLNVFDKYMIEYLKRGRMQCLR